MSRSSIHRWDQELRFRPADLGHADRAYASRPAGLRHDGAAVHPRAVLRRRQTRQAPHARPLARRFAAVRMGDAEPASRACASLAEATLMTTSPMLIEEADRAAYRRIEGGAADPLRRRLLRLLRAGRRLVDLVIETGIKPHDVVALVPIIEGAAGWSRPGTARTPPTGAESSLPATGPSMMRRGAFCSRVAAIAENRFNRGANRFK